MHNDFNSSRLNLNLELRETAQNNMSGRNSEINVGQKGRYTIHKLPAHI